MAFVENFIRDNPTHIDARTPFGGGTWLHYAAAEGKPEMIQLLVKLGFDVNRPGYQEDDLPLCCAASWNRLDNVHALLGLGSRIDTSKSVRNPLFAAIVGQSVPVVEILLARGIDARIQYKGTDAMAFALLRGESAIARTIANRLATGDAIEAERLLDHARRVALRRGPLRPIRIVPTKEDLECGS